MNEIVPEAGLEPARANAHWLLRPVRLPIPPPGQMTLCFLLELEIFTT